jgi:hypothetical protein
MVDMTRTMADMTRKEAQARIAVIEEELGSIGRTDKPAEHRQQLGRELNALMLTVGLSKKPGERNGARDEQARVALTLRLPRDQHELATALAKALGQSVNHLLTPAIEPALQAAMLDAFRILDATREETGRLADQLGDALQTHASPNLARRHASAAERVKELEVVLGVD